MLPEGMKWHSKLDETRDSELSEDNGEMEGRWYVKVMMMDVRLMMRL